MDSPQDTAALPAVGFPIRTSTDQSLVGGSPWLIAATHVLHRLLEPRHPPHALSSLVTLNSGLPSMSSSGAESRSRSRSFGKNRVPGFLKPGGADRSRTDDIQLAKLALYQLIYSPTKPSSEVGGPRWI